MRFWDTSALVPLMLRESTTEAALALHRGDADIVVAWTAAVECTSACVRRHRERAISDDGLVALLTRLRDFSLQWNVAEPTTQLRTTAQRLVARHGLRAGDAIQLASAAAASGDASGSIDFVCFDRRLRLPRPPRD